MKLIYKIGIGVATCLMIGFISGLSTQEAIENWYQFLEKPALNPPNWIFAPVWTILYILMGVSAALVWHEGWEKKSVQRALMLFLAQLIFNASWSVIFFGMQSAVGALVVILILWTLILVCIRRFYSIHRGAAWLLIPYLLWVTFATYLNASIVYLN